MAALVMHEALVMDVEAGLSPMTAIQAATLNDDNAQELTSK
jgi:hypothetical protein